MESPLAARPGPPTPVRTRGGPAGPGAARGPWPSGCGPCPPGASQPIGRLVVRQALEVTKDDRRPEPAWQPRDLDIDDGPELAEIGIVGRCRDVLDLDALLHPPPRSIATAAGGDPQRDAVEPVRRAGRGRATSGPSGPGRGTSPGTRPRRRADRRAGAGRHPGPSGRAATRSRSNATSSRSPRNRARSCPSDSPETGPRRKRPSIGPSTRLALCPIAILVRLLHRSTDAGRSSTCTAGQGRFNRFFRRDDGIGRSGLCGAAQGIEHHVTEAGGG